MSLLYNQDKIVLFLKTALFLKIKQKLLGTQLGI